MDSVATMVAVPPNNRITPGQAFTLEWGIGQALPLDKQLRKVLQVGLVAYDQWQISGNSGTVVSLLPYYSAHALGFQTSFDVPPKSLNLFSSSTTSTAPKLIRRGAPSCSVVLGH